ncbi:hypothetical protein A5659_10315 [Mycobacterium sp. 1165196.3]|uniref:hypothetical protein n=1 Tax=unclassified Mycobacterium TaxID=2642494 RepID=UPI00080248B9|nr:MULTISPECIES: hypothetical protein [unclassified Mycobacterium]OBJ02515.1 hypothetical protein A5624_05500 [Mycobacterium sp. 1482292.6]OBJ14796.1 hypothetical protein A5622_03340 [Mycobacterium sp. 1245801.1]OBJ85828.1 hypothetical protein A9W96_25900 [Mycobacterium sp. 1245852.3]OBK41446.1 hypothetical protein A5659_10315 [Mycobacterium sp. 1165196.3]OBK99493.1 hypothetical protein A5646_21495 [Mycobacterium sp. 1245499.0]
MTISLSARMGFGSMRNHYVLPDFSQSAELDRLVQNTFLRQLVLHGLVTVLLLAAVIAMSW